MPLQTIVTILALADKYGPQIFLAIKTLTEKKDATISDVEAVYMGLRPYDSFNIPEVAPVKPE